MQDKFELVKTYLQEMDVFIVDEDAEEELVVVDDEDNGIKNLVIDCEAPILVLEQVIMKVPDDPKDLFKRLLQMNREIVHGAFRAGRRRHDDHFSRYASTGKPGPKRAGGLHPRAQPGPVRIRFRAFAIQPLMDGKT